MPKAPWDLGRPPTPDELETDARTCQSCDNMTGVATAGTVGGYGRLFRPACVRLGPEFRFSAVEGVRSQQRALSCDAERSGCVLARLVDWLTGRERCGPDGRYWMPYQPRRAPEPPNEGSGGRRPQPSPAGRV